MYVRPNFKTKKALKDAVKNGEKVVVYAPGLGSPRVGEEAVEGPWSPQPHSWYARVVTEMRDGEVVVVKVKS